MYFICITFSIRKTSASSLQRCIGQSHTSNSPTIGTKSEINITILHFPHNSSPYSSKMSSKPKVLILGSPLDYVEKHHFDKFKEDYDVDVSRKYPFVYIERAPSNAHIRNRSYTPKTEQKSKNVCPTKLRKMGLIEDWSLRWVQ